MSYSKKGEYFFIYNIFFMVFADANGINLLSCNASKLQIALHTIENWSVN